jgi:ATP-binding cassette, subfamily B, bacterial PglK
MLKILKLLSKGDKVKILLVLLLIVLSAGAELLSIGMVIPFLSILFGGVNPEVKDILESLFGGSFETEGARNIITSIFVILVLIAGMVRILLVFVQTKVAYEIGRKITYTIFQRLVSQPYEDQSKHSTSEVITLLSKRSEEIVGKLILPAFILLGNAIIIVTIVSGMLWYKPIITLGIIGTIILFYTLIVVFFRKLLIKQSKLIGKESSNVVKTIQDTFGNIKEIYLNSNRKYFKERFAISDKKLRDAYSNIVILGSSPRFFIEAIGISSIGIGSVFIVDSYGSLIEALPIIAVIVLGTQRMMPISQQIYQSYTYIKSHSCVIKEIEDFIELDGEKLSSNKSICINEKLVFKNMSFKYKKSEKYILKDINITLHKSDVIGLVGNTGSGKSTLTELIMGLLSPSEGGIFIDGVKLNEDNLKSWRSNIAIVPQEIFLLDDTIDNNITLGKEAVNYERLKIVKKIACVDIFDKNKMVFVGERGKRLSGGQKQRVGIAKALYKNKRFIVMDEATNALDKEIEKKVLEGILKMKNRPMIVMVTHDPELIKYCNKTFKISHGKINA